MRGDKMEVMSSWSHRAEETRDSILRSIRESGTDRIVADRLLGIVDYLDTLLHGFFTLQQIMVQQYGKQGTGVADQIITSFEATFREQMSIIEARTREDLLSGRSDRNNAANTFYQSLTNLSGKTEEIAAEIYKTVLKKVEKADGKILAANLHSAVTHAIENIRNDKDGKLGVALRQAFVEIIQKALQADAETSTPGIDGLQKALAAEFADSVGKAVIGALHTNLSELDLRETIERKIGPVLSKAISDAIQETNRQDLAQYLADGAREAVRDALRGATMPGSGGDAWEKIEATQQGIIQAIETNQQVLSEVTRTAEKIAARMESLEKKLDRHLAQTWQKMQNMQFQLDNVTDMIGRAQDAEIAPEVCP